MNKTIFLSAAVGAASALLVGGAVALATNMTFVLGAANNPDALTTVAAQNKDTHGGLNGPLIQLTNASTGGAATPLGLTAGSGRPPFATNSSAKVANLNADRLDGMDSAAFVQGAGAHVFAKKTVIQPGHSAEVLNATVKPLFNMIYDCPSDLITQGTATFFNRSVLDADLVADGSNGSDATHGGYGASISMTALQSGVTFDAGWKDGHVATAWLFVDHRYNEPDPAANGCYVSVMATEK